MKVKEVEIINRDLKLSESPLLFNGTTMAIVVIVVSVEIFLEGEVEHLAFRVGLIPASASATALIPTRCVGLEGDASCPAVHPAYVVRAEVCRVIHCSRMRVGLPRQLSVLEVPCAQIMVFDELRHVVLHDILVAGQELFLADYRGRVLDLALIILLVAVQVLGRAQVAALLRRWTGQEKSLARRNVQIVITRHSEAQRARWRAEPLRSAVAIASGDTAAPRPSIC